jgi:hypothetical protein
VSREYDARQQDDLVLRPPRLAPDLEGPDLVHRALERARGADAARDYRPDPVVQQTTTGARAVHLQQHHLGIPVFEGSHTVRFSDGGRRVTDIERTCCACKHAGDAPASGRAGGVLGGWAGGDAT